MSEGGSDEQHKVWGLVLTTSLDARRIARALISARLLAVFSLGGGQKYYYTPTRVGLHEAQMGELLIATTLFNTFVGSYCLKSSDVGEIRPLIIPTEWKDFQLRVEDLHRQGEGWMAAYNYVGCERIPSDRCSANKKCQHG